MTEIGRSVSIDKAAELLGVSRRTIYYRIKAGTLQVVPLATGYGQRVLLSSLPAKSPRPPQTDEATS